MTTLGALLVGLLLLLVLLGVFAWLQRRSRRGPEQPRTVADLVRMREAARPHSDEAESALSEPAASTDEPEPVEAGPEAVGGPPEVVESPVAHEALRAEARLDAHASAGAAAPVVVSPPEDATVDMPWARAARMVEPWRDTAAPDAPTADVAPVVDQPRPNLTLLSSDKVDARSRRASYWAVRTKSSHHPSTPVAEPGTQAAASDAGVQPGESRSEVADSQAKPTSRLGSAAAPADSAEAVDPLRGRTDSPVEPANAQVGSVHSGSEPADSPVEAAGSATVPVDSRPASVEVTSPLADVAGSPEPDDPPAAAAEVVDSSADAVGSAAVPEEPLAAAAGVVDSSADAVGSAAVPEEPPAAAAGVVDPSGDGVGSATVREDPPAPPAEIADPSATPGDLRAASPDPTEPSADVVDDLVERIGVPADPRPGAVAQPSEQADAPAGAPPDVVEAPAAVLDPSPTHAFLADTRRVDEDTPAQPSAPPTNGHGPRPTPARVAGRVRRRPSATPAEQAAADLALLRTFGVPSRNGTAGEPEVELEGCTPADDEPVAGEAQPIAFRVLARHGRGIHGATVTLLDDHGRETAGTRTRSDGSGVLTARHPGGYMLVAAADGYQPGAITVAVTAAPVDAEIPLTRSASIAGTVGGEDGPIVGAQLALVQDGEIVDTTESATDGAYRFADLAAGEYGLSVTAYDCEAAAFVLALADEVDLRQDVELVPAGLPADDVMTAPR